MLTKLRNARYKGVVEGSRRAPPFDEFHQFESRAFSCVFDILLIGHADDQNFRVAQAAPGPPVELMRELVDHIVRHRRVNFTGEFDESRRDLKLARFPCQIEWVDRDTVTAEPGPRI